MLTSKQGTLFAAISNYLREKGHDVLVTCREYEYTCEAVRKYGIDPVKVGMYGEGDLEIKLQADIERMLRLIPLVKKFIPDALLAYPNPSASRVAYGLGIPYIAMTDSPHSEIPSRLSLPLSHAVIFSTCIKRESIERFLFRDKTKLVSYYGVDEMAWIIRRRPILDNLKELGLSPGEYVVFRPHEYMASYYRDLSVELDPIRVVGYLQSHNLTTVIIPRYSSHKLLVNQLRKRGYDIRVPHKGYDGLTLVYYARAVITGGGTLAREAALVGTPGLTYYPEDLDVNKCVREWGFPLYRVNSTDDLLKKLSEVIDKEKEMVYDDILNRLSLFEDPAEVVLNVIEGISK